MLLPGYKSLDCRDLAQELRKYPAGLYVGVAVDENGEMCRYNRPYTEIIPIVCIRQNDEYVTIEYGYASEYSSSRKTVYDILKIITVSRNELFDDLKQMGREFKQGLYGLFGKEIPSKEYREVSVLSRTLKMQYDICEVKMMENYVCLFR